MLLKSDVILTVPASFLSFPCSEFCPSDPDFKRLSRSHKGWKVYGTDGALDFNEAVETCYDNHGASLWRAPEDAWEAKMMTHIIRRDSGMMLRTL